jgi:glucosyl-dolichyl phosphate glucuronosyltransferase
VIDNNSTDDTARRGRLVHGVDPVAPHVVETRQGLDHGRNRAIEEASGEVIVLVDDDVLVGARLALPAGRPILLGRAHSIGVVGGEVVPVFPEGIPDWLEGSHGPLAFRADPGPLPPGQAPMGANFAFPKWAFERFGMFDTPAGPPGREPLRGRATAR